MQQRCITSHFYRVVEWYSNGPTSAWVKQLMITVKRYAQKEPDDAAYSDENL